MKNERFERFKLKLLSHHPSYKEIFEIADGLKEENFFIAGGTVRDFLCSKEAHYKDGDLFISNFGLKAMEPLFEISGTIEKNQFGNLRWFPKNGDNFYYDVIVMENFYNGLWNCTNIKDVLTQFDFTANAIAFDLKNGKLHDPLNGLKHAKEKELRAVRFDYPDTLISNSVPISRNSVLWFRYLYYAKKLCYTIEPITKEWINKNSFRVKDKKLFTKFFFNPDL